MDKPKITWFVKKSDDDSYKEDSEYYAGSYNQSNNLNIDLMVWNNRYGTENVEDLENFGFKIWFDDEEDASLLKYLTFSLNNVMALTPVITKNEALVQLPTGYSISGAMNDGTQHNLSNFITLRIKLAVPSSKKIKYNDLKTLNFTITTL